MNWRGGASLAFAIALAGLSNPQAMAQSVETRNADPGAVYFSVGGGEAVRFLVFSLKSEVFTPIAENDLNHALVILKARQTFRNNLSAAEGEIVDAMILKVRDSDSVFLAAPSDGKPTIVANFGFSYFTQTNAVVQYFSARYQDPIIAVAFLRSEARRAAGRKRYFDINLFLPVVFRDFTKEQRQAAMEEYEAAKKKSIWYNRRSMNYFALLHEMCHYFLGHQALESPPVDFVPRTGSTGDKELDADDCAAKHLKQLGLDPTYSLSLMLGAFAVADGYEGSHHPITSERVEAILQKYPSKDTEYFRPHIEQLVEILSEVPELRNSDPTLSLREFLARHP